MRLVDTSKSFQVGCLLVQLVNKSLGLDVGLLALKLSRFKTVLGWRVMKCSQLQRLPPCNAHSCTVAC